MHEGMDWQVSIATTQSGILIEQPLKCFSFSQKGSPPGFFYLIESIKENSLFYSVALSSWFLQDILQSMPILALKIIMLDMLYLPFFRLGKGSA